MTNHMDLLTTFVKDFDIDFYKDKYKKELTNYEYIDNVVQFSLLKPGGVLRCVNFNGKLVKGGIIMKINKDKYNLWFAFVSVPSLKYGWNMFFDRYMIFYKKTPKEVENDNFRKLLISFIN